MAKKDIVKKKKNEVIREAKIDNVYKNNPKLVSSIILSAVLIILVLISIFVMNDEFDFSKFDNKVSDSQKFEEEYEEYNGKENNYGKEYLSIDVSDDNNIKYSSYEEVFSILEDKSGVIYFGFPTCPWCRNLVPVLLDAADEVGLDNIYYLNNLDSRDVKILNDDGEVVVDKEGTKNYYKLVDELSSVLGEYEGLNNSSIKRLYFPTVIFVKNGEIVGSHIGTVDSQEDPYKKLDKVQYKELKTILEDLMYNTISCDGAC